MCSSKTHFPLKLSRPGKATKLPRKSKRRTQKISNKDKSNTSLFYKFFLSKDRAYIETYKKYSLGKKATENYKVSAALIYLHPCRIALCSVLSPNTTVPSVQSLLHHKWVFLITLFFSLVMSVFWLQLPCVFVGPLHIVDAYFSQNFFQVYLKGNKRCH